MNNLKTILQFAAQVVLFRGGDINTEDGTYATTECDGIINLESSIADYFKLGSDDVTSDNFNDLTLKIDSLPDIEQLQQRNTELEKEIERLRKSVLQLIEAGDGLIENNGHLSSAYHQAKSGWYRAKHTSKLREQSK